MNPLRILSDLINEWYLLALNRRNNFENLKKKKLVGEIGLAQKVDSFLASPTDCLYVLGALGSGKSHQIAHYFNSKKSPKISYCGFFGVKSLESAYQHLVPIRIQVIGISLLLSSIIFFHMFLDYKAIKISEALYLSWGLITLFLLRNTFKLFYLIGNTLQTFSSWWWWASLALAIAFSFLDHDFFFQSQWALLALFAAVLLLGLISAASNNKTQIIIIDDLDRSLLNFEERFALLSNLWRRNRKYIILLGFFDEDQKAKTIETVSKLEGRVLIIPSDEDINFQLASGIDKEFPFSKSDWLNYIEPRTLLTIVSEVKSESEGLNLLFKKFFYLTKLIDHISSKLSLSPFDRQRITFGIPESPNIANPKYPRINRRTPDEPKLRFTTESEQSPPLAMDIVNKIYDSLTDDAEIKTLYKNGLYRNLGSDFPTLFRFNMSKKGMFNLYDENNFK